MDLVSWRPAWCTELILSRTARAIQRNLVLKQTKRKPNKQKPYNYLSSLDVRKTEEATLCGNCELLSLMDLLNLRRENLEHK